MIVILQFTTLYSIFIVFTVVYEYDAVALFTGDGFDGTSFSTQYNIFDVAHFGFQVSQNHTHTYTQTHRVDFKSTSHSTQKYTYILIFIQK